jgi:hypothetical protein
MTRSMRASLTAALLSACTAGAQAPAAQPPQRPPERPDDPYRPAPGAARTSVPVAPTGPHTRAGLRTVQVNTNAQGMNIIGDAANEPSLTVDPTAPNRMAIGWRQFDTITSNFRQAGRAYSIDGGRTWTNPGVLTPGIFRTDPVLDTTAAGRFYYNSLYGTTLTSCDTFISTDAGTTWSTPVPSFGGDKNWMAVDRVAGSQGLNNIYLTWSPFFSCCGPGIFSRSTDNGLSYMSPFPIPQNPYFGTMAIGPAGELYIAGISADASAFPFTVVRSTNARDPAATPTFDRVTSVNLGGQPLANTNTGPNPGGLDGQVWIVCDTGAGPRRGWLYLCCSVDPPGADPLDLMIAHSADGGLTWSTPVRINDDPPTSNAWQWMSTLSISPSGRLDAVWNDTRGSDNFRLSRTYHSSSSDGGQTWSPNMPLGSTWNSYIGWPNQNKIGDYYEIISDDVGASVIYATTYNGEQDIYFTRIGDDDCNRNGVGDLIDLSTGALHDCNGDGIPDECQIASGQLADLDHDGIPDICQCPADFNHDGSVNIQDFLAYLAAYAANDPRADTDHSGAINVQDFLAYLAVFGAGC